MLKTWNLKFEIWYGGRLPISKLGKSFVVMVTRWRQLEVRNFEKFGKYSRDRFYIRLLVVQDGSEKVWNNRFFYYPNLTILYINHHSDTPKYPPHTSTLTPTAQNSSKTMNHTVFLWCHKIGVHWDYQVSNLCNYTFR